MAPRRWKAAGSANAANTPARPVDSMYDEANLGVPPKGVYRCTVRRLEATASKAGDPMVKCVVNIAERGGKKEKYNGYDMWTYVLATEEFEDKANQFLDAISGGGTKAAAVRKAFWGSGVTTDADGMITKIGTLAVKDTGFEIGVNTRKEAAKDGYDARLSVGSFFPASKLPEPEDGEDAESDEDDAEEPDEEYEEEETGDDEEADDEAAQYQAELEEYTISQLRTLAKGDDYPEISAADIRGLDKDGIVELIMGVAFPDEEADADEIEEEPESEEDEEPEDEEEEEPPAKPARRGRPAARATAASKPAAKTRSAAPAPARRGKRRPF